LSPAGSDVAANHLRLADGLIGTTAIRRDCSEYEMRNAYSRSYYALFHACHGYLRAAGFDVDNLNRKHTTLHAEMGRRMGKWFGQFFRGAWELRCRSDYDSGWSVPPYYSCVKRLEEARSRCHSVAQRTKGLISQAVQGDRG
jgi:uncharacterized protein (UPF0332 family)